MTRPYTFDRVVRMVVTAVCVVAAIWLIDALKSVLLPFLVAWLMAYMMEPLVQINRRYLHLSGRVLAVIITLVEVCATLVLLAMFILPQLFAEMHYVARMVSDYAVSRQNVPFIPESVHEFLRSHIDFGTIASKMTSQDMRKVIEYLLSFLSSGYDFVMGIFNWFAVVLYVIFIMIDYDKLLRGFRRMVPPKYRHIVFGICTDVKNSMNHYFRGQALVAFIVGILFCIGFVIVGLPLAVVMGLFIGLLNMVPYLQLISLIPTTLLCLVCATSPDVDFWTIWWECMAVYIVVQCIQDLYLTPKIMGKAMGLNPAIILLSLSIWGSLFGLIGLIIALPMTTLILSYYDRYINPRTR